MEHNVETRVLIGLDTFAALAALIGFVMLVTGWPYRWPLDYLEPTPFSDYTVPGLILGIVVGGSAIVATWAMLRSPSAGAVASMVAGLIMMGWIVGEYALVPAVRVTLDEPVSWEQPLMFAIGLAMVALAVRVVPGGWKSLARFHIA
jgi:hypothetical protein